MEQNYYTRGEKEFLLKIARTALAKYLINSEKFEPQTVNQKLWEKRGVFATLHKKGQLRGCLGCLEPVESLILGVRDNVLLAAKDPRFLPVELSELNEIKIEISILTAPEKVRFDQIKYGDGVVIKRGEQSATYLPPVWRDLKEPEIFFSTLCQKAGLERDCYKNEMTEFYRYEAIVFREGRI